MSEGKGREKLGKKKVIELQKEIDQSTIRVVDFNTPLPVMDRSRGQKIQ